MAKVLVCCEFATLNGGENSMLSTLPILQRAGFRITIAAPEQGPLIDVLGSMGIEHLPLPYDRWRREGLSQDKRRLEIAELLRSYGPDLIHANSPLHEPTAWSGCLSVASAKSGASARYLAT